jgi:hypothetical protein
MKDNMVEIRTQADKSRPPMIALSINYSDLDWQYFSRIGEENA